MSWILEFSEFTEKTVPTFVKSYTTSQLCAGNWYFVCENSDWASKLKYHVIDSNNTAADNFFNMKDMFSGKSHQNFWRTFFHSSCIKVPTFSSCGPPRNHLEIHLYGVDWLSVKLEKTCVDYPSNPRAWHFRIGRIWWVRGRRGLIRTGNQSPSILLLTDDWYFGAAEPM